MNTPHTSPCSRLIQSGFTLVEIMVGMAIGLLTALVIVQVLSVYESQKSTTMGTADAQTNGSIALYTITRDLQMAGYPLIPTSGSPFKCTTLNILQPGVTNISPVSITDIGTSDTITIRYGDSALGGIPSEIMAGPAGNNLTLDNTLGCRAGDVTLAIDTTGTNCTISSASAVPDATTITLDNVSGVAVGDTLACLGAWNEVTYRVNNGNLERQNSAVSAAFFPTVPDIVNIQAQYGISADPTSNQVTQWVNASAAPWNAPTITERNRIKAVRIAVVARNAKRETAVVTNALNSWTGTVASPAPAIDLSGDYPDWGHYRYRVFETIIPLRNMIWSRGAL